MFEKYDHDQFFEMISRKLNAFLRGFQTNKPMVPFITDTLKRFGFWLLWEKYFKWFSKKEIKLYNLIQIDSLEKNI